MQRFCKPKVGSSILSTGTIPPSLAERSCARVPTCRQALCSVVAMSARGVTLGFKYFDEFSHESTFEGNSLQISFAVNLK